MVKNGDTAKISVDSYPGRTFLGSVYRIANTATASGTGTQDQVTNFEVRILLDAGPNAVFRPGMSVSADIETETHYHVLSVPIQSVTVRLPKVDPKTQDDNGAHLATEKKKDSEKVEEVIFAVKDGVARTVPVHRGISDDAYTEVSSATALEGLDVVAGPFKAINRDLEHESKVKIETKDQTHTGASADKK
jgi:HlyD family secretion protein